MSSEHKHRRQAELRAQADERERLEAVAAPRHVDTELYHRGVGIALLRIAVLHSFHPAVLFEVYQRDGALIASVSRGTEPDDPRVTGQSQLNADPAVLRGFLDGLSNHPFELRVAHPTIATCDGTRIIATIRSCQATCRLEWVEGDVPPEWAGGIAHILKIHEYLASQDSAAQ